MSDPVVIGIHGLKNKPEPTTLEAWWRESLHEGFRRNQGRDFPGQFQLVYWADIMHEHPLSIDEDPEPYAAAGGVGPLPRHVPTPRSVAVTLGTEVIGGTADNLSGIPVVSSLVYNLVAKRAPDLHRYYHDARRRAAVRGRLVEVLGEAHQRQRPIMLIAHSMGSIIAFDVLCANSQVPGLNVPHFLTLGSPLGLREVKAKAKEECGERLRVPACVERWDNLADRRDRIALDSLLSTDYAANAGGVFVRDRAVINEYVSPKTRESNPHKVYGYLRTPEVTDLLHQFLGGSSARAS